MADVHKRLLNESISESMHEGRNEEVNPIPSWVLELPSPPSHPQKTWEPAIGTTTGTLFTNTRLGPEAGGKVDRGKAGSLLLLLPPPDDDHAASVAGSQQALIAVEADIQHGRAVALQLVDGGLGCPLHVKEMHAHVLATRHCPDERRPSGGAAGGSGVTCM